MHKAGEVRSARHRLPRFHKAVYSLEFLGKVASKTMAPIASGIAFRAAEDRLQWLYRRAAGPFISSSRVIASTISHLIIDLRTFVSSVRCREEIAEKICWLSASRPIRGNESTPLPAASHERAFRSDRSTVMRRSSSLRACDPR